MPLLHTLTLTVFAVVITTPHWPVSAVVMLGAAVVCLAAVAFALGGERRHNRS